ncbi:MAG: helix-turn-helix domain-containing protein [Ignavibacteriae bacterium]|nr:helix-turn-helix domain-containing protein [Ignavibacteriota bacterium]
MDLQSEQYPKTRFEILYNKYKNLYSLNDVEEIIEKVVNDCVPRVVAVFLEQQKTDPELDLLSRKEVCNILKVTGVTLHNYKHSGKLVPIKKNGRVYYKKTDLIKYLKQKEA